MIVGLLRAWRGDSGASSLVTVATFPKHSSTNSGRGACSSLTKLRKKMKNRLLPLLDKVLLRKRALSETVNDQLKNICQIEHTRHRSPVNFIVNLTAGLIAYTYQERKPSLRFHAGDLVALPATIF